MSALTAWLQTGWDSCLAGCDSGSANTLAISYIIMLSNAAQLTVGQKKVGVNSKPWFDKELVDWTRVCRSLQSSASTSSDKGVIDFLRKKAASSYGG